MARKPKSRAVACLKGNLLTILTVTGVVAGIALGLILKEAKDEWGQRNISYVKFIGDIFLSMLKGLILPLIISSLVAAVGSLDLSLSTKIGGKGIAFYMTTTLLAIILGIILAVTIKPGKNKTEEEETGEEKQPTLVQDALLDLVRQMFPPNLIQATLDHFKTQLTPPKNYTNETSYEKYVMNETMEPGTNIMGLVVFSIALGISLAKLGPKGKALLGVFQSLSEASMMMTGWVIWLSPVGVTFLIAGEILKIDDFQKVIESLGLYFATVVAGLTIHGLIVLPLIYFFFTRKLPFSYVGNMAPALFTAFGTGSSTATLPVAFKCLEEGNKVDKRVTRFLLPIGATINMDGTALYEAVAAIFIAQLVGMDLPIGKIVAISVTATAASIGAAGIPQAGLVTMVMVLNTIGLPPESISYIIPIDWLLDRFRTCINVLGDSFGAGIVEHLSREELAALPSYDDDDDTEDSKAVSDDLETVQVDPKKTVSGSNETNRQGVSHQDNQAYENEY